MTGWGKGDGDEDHGISGLDNRPCSGKCPRGKKEHGVGAQSRTEGWRQRWVPLGMCWAHKTSKRSCFRMSLCSAAGLSVRPRARVHCANGLTEESQSQRQEGSVDRIPRAESKGSWDKPVAVVAGGGIRQRQEEGFEISGCFDYVSPHSTGLLRWGGAEGRGETLGRAGLSVIPGSFHSLPGCIIPY